MAQVVLKDLNKRFDEIHAVKDLNIQIRDKEFLVLVGPSGCGKTTTLRMMAGLEDITSGEIYIGDQLVNNLPPKNRDIAMVFQNYALYPHMTVYDNMAFGLKMRKFPKAEIDQRVGEAAILLGIRRPPEPQAATALGRAAAAGGGGACHRPTPPGLPLRRAPLQPRRQAARADARRVEAAARAGWRPRPSTSPTTRWRR